MKKHPLKATYYLWIVFWLVLFSALPGQAKITIGIIGDQFGVHGQVGTDQFEKNKAAAYQALADGVAALNQEGPMDTVLHVGDLTESTQTDDVIAADFNRVVKLMATLSSKSRPKWFLSPGEHDINPLEWVQNSRDRSKETHFLNLYRAVNPKIGIGKGNPLYYSFDINDYHFVSLYSHDHLRCDPRWGNIYLARISDTQLAWLEKDLEAAAGTRGIIVFTHQPLWYNQSAWTRVHRLLARFNTKAVIAGHYHYDQNDHVSDGIQYRVVGALGGHVKSADADAGGWWHVTRLTVDDDGNLEWQLIPVKGGPKNTFTSRWDMDRVQAMDYALGTAVQYLSNQAIYLKDGKLVDRDRKTPAAITLTGLGNPVDQTVTTTIEIKKNLAGYTLRTAKFEPGICENASDGTACRVPPGANIAFSNNSTVRPACARFSPDFSQCLEYKPFWRGELAFSGTGVPMPGDGISLTISMVFTSESSGRQMRIWKDAVVRVKAFEESHD